MKRFRVEHSNWEKPDIFVSLTEGPYTTERILYKTGWNKQSVTITDVTSKFQGEE